jgi:hypothetical protein
MRRLPPSLTLLVLASQIPWPPAVRPRRRPWGCGLDLDHPRMARVPLPVPGTGYRVPVQYYSTDDLAEPARPQQPEALFLRQGWNVPPVTTRR